jgi:hypothetical protein
VSPILGIFASQGRVAANSYESIATATVGSGGQSTAISFTSIPSTYKHLQFRYILRSSSASGAFNTTCIFNSDSTAANYAGHRLQGNGSAAAAGAQTGNGWAWFGPYTNGTEAGSNVFSVGVVDILDYADTNKAKTVRSIGGYDANGSGYAMMTSGLWTQTTAINRVDIRFETNPSTYPFAQYSQIALYGIKG